MLFSTSKLRNNESKSQPGIFSTGTLTCCLAPQSYEIMKANHNGNQRYNQSIQLFSTSKLRNNESKSQLTGNLMKFCVGCLAPQSYEIMKANHNGSALVVYWVMVV